MKQIIFTLFLMYSIAFSVRSQTINIPDLVFKSFLVSNNSIDSNNDDEIQLSEAQAVTYLYINNSFISSFSGIEHFVNVTQLTIASSNLPSIDLSYFPDLEYLSLGSNLTEVDLSHNPMLNWLVIHNNNLSSLDISHNPELVRLHCGSNNLTSLDVSANPKLERLTFYDNQVSSIDLSNNPLLIDLECWQNNLSSLDLSNNINIEKFLCQNNALSSLDLSNNTALVTVKCFDNQITELNVSHSPGLIDIDCRDNQLNNILVHPNLSYLNCSNNDLTSLDLSPNLALSFLNCSGNPGLPEIKIHAISMTENGYFVKDAPAIWVEGDLVVTATKSGISETAPACYPNPATDIVIFGEKPVEVILFSSVGEKVLQGKFASIDISLLPAGIYHVQITGPGKRTSIQKLVKE